MNQRRRALGDQVASWDGVGRCYDAGGNADGVRLDGAYRAICKLSGSSGLDAAERPANVGVSMSYRYDGPPWAGTVDVVGVVRWSSGRGTTEAEFDITAWGTQVSLTGGADMLEVGVRATGDAVVPHPGQPSTPLVLTVSALVSVGDTAHVAPFRTLEHVMPADQALIRRIPSYAHAFHMRTTNFTNLTNALCEILADDIAAAPTVIATIDIWPNTNNQLGVRQVIPGGAHFYRFSRTGGMWAPARLRTCFELAL